MGLCFLPPRRFQGLNAGCQVWQQVCLLPDQRGEQVSLYSPGGSRTRYVDQAGFKLVTILPVLLSETGIPGHVPPPPGYHIFRTVHRLRLRDHDKSVVTWHSQTVDMISERSC